MRQWYNAAMQQAPKGLTLIESLIIGGVFAVLLFATGIAVSAARERVRDYKRISDITRIQAALELYFNEHNEYPKTSDGRIALGAEGSRCLSTAGLQPSCAATGRVYLNPVPSQTDIGLKGSDLPVYAYESDGEDYAIAFIIERAVPQVTLSEGLVCAYPGEPIQAARGNGCPLR